jgi:hypothetical protein
MIPAWAVSLPIASAQAAAGLRLEPRIEVLETADALWLRGDAANDRLNGLLRQLPGAERFDVLSSGELRPDGSRLPQGKLPGGNWIHLKTWAQVELPTAAFAAVATTAVPLALVRTGDESEANVLLMTLADWKTYGERAPQLRLARLRFAMSAGAQVVVQGSPLPPLPGQRYCERAGVAVPCGWGWSPPVEPELLRDAWQLTPHDLALVHTDATWDHLREDQFVPATHSAIRDTVSAHESQP